MDALRVLLCRIGCYQWDSSTRAHVERVSGEASEQRTNMIVVLIVTPMSTLFDPSSTTTRIAIGTLRVHRSPNILTIPTRWQVTRNGKPKQGIGSLVFHDCMFEYLKSMHYITPAVVAATIDLFLSFGLPPWLLSKGCESNGICVITGKLAWLALGVWRKCAFSFAYLCPNRTC